jgi:AraC-like DNA-binding protein
MSLELSSGTIATVPYRLSLVRHDSALGFWESVTRLPAPRLRELIVGPYQGWVEKTGGTMVRREVPSGIIPIIINLGPAFGLVDPAGRAPTRYVGSFLAGMHESYALAESGASSYCVQVNFQPLGARRLLGVPLYTLTNRVLELTELIGPEADRLADRLHAAPDWESRFATLDDFIAGRVERAAPIDPRVGWAWQRLNASGGAIGMSALAAELNCSHKHLIARFRHEIGLPPKTVARIIRFGRVAELLKHGAVDRWASIAQRCGYYDQAHLIRDFREFAGSTPGEYLGRVLPDGGGVADF